MRKLLISTLSLAVLATGCGQATSPTSGAPAVTAAPTAVAAATAPASTVAPIALPTGAPPSPTAEGAEQPRLTTPSVPERPTSAASEGTPDPVLLDQARARLAALRNIDLAKLTLTNSVAQEWGDTSLGCPDPATMYLQVITPGFILTFNDGSRDYAVHTAATEGQMVLCENNSPTPLNNAGDQTTPPQPQSVGTPNPALVPTSATGDAVQPSAASQPMIDRAQQVLAQEESLNAADISLVSVEAVEWPDGSMGCPQPNVRYLQVITPGYRIVLAAGGKQYEYHTDTKQQAIRCSNMPASMPNTTR